MRHLRMTDGFIPVSELESHADDWLRRVEDDDAPVVVTRDGKPAGVLLSPRAFDELTERARFIEAVEQGLADADASRVHSHDEVVRAMKSRFGTSAA